MPNAAKKTALTSSLLPDRFPTWRRESPSQLPEHLEFSGRHHGKTCKASLRLVTHDEPASTIIDTRPKDFNAAYSCKEAFKACVENAERVLFLFRDNKALLMEATEETKQIVQARKASIQESIYPWDRAMSRIP